MLAGALALARGGEKKEKKNTAFIFKVQSIKLKAQVIIKQIKMERASFFCLLYLVKTIHEINCSWEGRGKKKRRNPLISCKTFSLRAKKLRIKWRSGGGGGCLWDHFTRRAQPDDTSSIAASFKDITVICGGAEVILTYPPPPPPTSLPALSGSRGPVTGVPPTKSAVTSRL